MTTEQPATTQQTDPPPAATLDTSGLLCPLPVYKTALALKGIEPGEILELICTDPGSLADIPAMVRQRGDDLINIDDQGAKQVFTIRKGSKT